MPLVMSVWRLFPIPSFNSPQMPLFGLLTLASADLTSGSIEVRKSGNRVGERDTNGWELWKRLAMFVHTLKKGDRVLAPFAFSDGTCEFCHKGIQTACIHGGFWGTTNDGGQAEAIRAPLADGTLVVIPKDVENDDDLLTAILPLTDVMSTGHHAASGAGVRPGSTVAVVGDGAVGLCGVLAAKRLGAERIIILGRHKSRLEIARRFGATDVVSSRGESAIAAVKEMTSGGALSVLECVGSESAMATAQGIARPGGAIGYVGVPHGSSQNFNLGGLFMSNITLRGGAAPARLHSRIASRYCGRQTRCLCCS